MGVRRVLAEVLPDAKVAEIAMATSSTTVVSNANRLRRVDIRPRYAREDGAGRVLPAATAWLVLPHLEWAFTDIRAELEPQAWRRRLGELEGSAALRSSR